MEEMRIQEKILKFLGNWPEDTSGMFAKLSATISLLIGYIFVATMMMEVFKHLHSYDILSELLAVIAAVVCTHVKVIIFRKNFKPLALLLKMLHLKNFNNHPKEVDNIMRKCIKMSTILGSLYQFTCFFTVSLYCVTPLLTKVDLPVRFTYLKESYKPAVYIFQVLGLASAVANNCSIDIMAISLMGRAAAQIEILNKKISNFKDDHSNKSKDRSSIYRQNLKSCVLHHNEIIRFIETIEEAFSGICLIQFLESIAAICNIGFQLVLSKPGSIKFATMIVYFLAMMGQLGMYCWYGNEIIQKSLEIKYACYESEWIDCDVQIQKMLIIITERSMRPLQITAAKFSIVCLSSFTAVIKTSYSYFALMQRLYANTQN